MALHRFTRRSALVTLTTGLLLGVPLAAGALIGACGGEDTTSSKRVALKTRVVVDDGVTAPFTNAYGWSIKLSLGAVSIGPLYYFDGAPIFSASLPSRRQDALSRFLGIATAWAHPGHYQPGNAMGQVLEPSSVDLLETPADLPPGNGVAGVYRSARFTFQDKPQGGAAAELEGHVVVLEGEAKKDTMTRLFRAVADVADVLDSYGEPKLEGCTFDGEPDVEADGTVTVHLKPSVWLDQAEFDAIPESMDEKPVLLTPDTEAFKAFARGLKKGSAVIFAYSTP
jgi:hypothetical protein